MSGVGTAGEARGPFAERIVTEVVISAPPERVWDILVDIARYPTGTRSSSRPRVISRSVDGSR